MAKFGLLAAIFFAAFVLLWPLNVPAQITYELSCPAGLQPVNAPGAISYNPSSGKFRANFCIDGSGNVTYQAGGVALLNPATSQTIALLGNTLSINNSIGVASFSVSGGSGAVSVGNYPFTVGGSISGASYKTATDCASSASPAVCGSAPTGSFVMAATTSTVTVNTTAVTASSEIFIQYDETLGTKLSVTCNNTTTQEAAQNFVRTRTPGTSFIVQTNVTPATNPACFDYWIIN